MLAHRDDKASQKLKLCDSLSSLFDFSQIGRGTALAVVGSSLSCVFHLDITIIFVILFNLFQILKYAPHTRFLLVCGENASLLSLHST